MDRGLRKTRWGELLGTRSRSTG